MAEKKILDVAKPGTTPADETAKPVIVGHRPKVLDPMVNEEKPMPNQDTASETPASTQAVAVKPVSSDLKHQSQLGEEAPKTDEAADFKEVKDASKTADEELEKEAVLQAEIKELVATKKYFVEPSNPARSSATAFVLTALFVVIIGLAVLAFLHDAGAIDLGIKLPFDLIR
ncbi:hypothetical protein IPO96_03445 [Candidatus Saccharibacteria bacterium]|jgi:hypothetical protein|nr:MAG: hypothetical protein IPO96_03445 [Candidatus Saccharibacteria bacterium]